MYWLRPSSASGGGQVVQAADGASGPTPQGVSLSAYKKTLHALLEKLSLSGEEKEKYKKQIDSETELSKLIELEEILNQLQQKKPRMLLIKRK
ncbi:hypothetical protein [Streptococcus pseudopneumoniae]|uniref:hypothetical protein n=1 Tax=Streptococcus pseudopneumoniae TaxID=257758 RepID=UPI00160115D8|nr:hypothetical protein [Streptococcus pseudopneumoniae]